jgi:hypothetical protein
LSQELFFNHKVVIGYEENQMYLLELAPQISKEKESKQGAVNASYQSWQLSLESYLKNLEMLGEKVNDMMRLLIAVHDHRESYAF